MYAVNNILIPTDFSPAAWNAVQYGLLFQKLHQASITLMHVYPVDSKYNLGKSSITESENSTIIELKKRMNLWVEELKKLNNANIKSEIKIGKVVPEISQLFHSGKFDLIILGNNGGSINNEPGTHTSEIIKKSGFPVLIVPACLEKFQS